MNFDMISVKNQQSEALLYTADRASTNPANSASTEPPKVDMKQFEIVASWLGMLLGMLTVAADIGGHVFLLVDNDMSVKEFLTFTVTWSTTITLSNIAVFLLIRHMIKMVNHDDDVLEAFERRCLLWAITGVSGTYTFLDVLVMPMSKFLISFGAMVTTISVYKVLLTYIQKLNREDKVKAATHKCERVPRLLIV